MQQPVQFYQPMIPGSPHQDQQKIQIIVPQFPIATTPVTQVRIWSLPYCHFCLDSCFFCQRCGESWFRRGLWRVDYYDLLTICIDLVGLLWSWVAGSLVDHKLYCIFEVYRAINGLPRRPSCWFSLLFHGRLDVWGYWLILLCILFRYNLGHTFHKVRKVIE